MRTLQHILYYPSRSDHYNIWHLTDLHVGAKAFDEKLFRQHVKEIEADPMARWIGGGDYIDAVCHVGDKRYNPEVLAEWALGENDVMGAQIDYAVNLMTPIARKCIGMGVGNHEFQADKHYGRQVYWEIVSQISRLAKVPAETLAYGVQGFILLNFRRGTARSNGNSWQFIIYAHHGFGGGRLPGGHALTLHRTLSDYHCDLALMGHRHVLQIVPKTITVPGGRTAKTRQAYGIFMPSYLGQYIEPKANGKPIDTYPELFGLPATPLGAFPITVYPMARRMSLVVQSDILGAGDIWERAA